MRILKELKMQKKYNKINIILPGLGESGGINVIYVYKKLLEKNGWDVIIYASIIQNNLHRYSSEIKNLAHQIYCTKKAISEKNNKQDIKWVLNISNNTVRDADIIVATMWVTAYDVARLKPSKGKKFYFIQDFEIWDNKEWGLNSYKLPLNKIVISTRINEQLKNELGMGPFPVVMNGIDTDVFHDRKIRDESTKIFLMLNHNLKKKGVQYGIQVFERIKEKYPDAQLKMFGMCDRSNLPDYVEYYQNPSKEQLLTLYNTANFFLFPSLEEGWGLTPIEAMACGCIVFGTNTGFVMDIGKHQENMMISEPGDVDGMVRNIEDILRNKNLRRYLQDEMHHSIEILKWENSLISLERLLTNVQ